MTYELPESWSPDNKDTGQMFNHDQMLEAYAAGAAAQREAALNCYSPDDSAHDWADKIRNMELVK